MSENTELEKNSEETVSVEEGNSSATVCAVPSSSPPLCTCPLHQNTSDIQENIQLEVDYGRETSPVSSQMVNSMDVRDDYHSGLESNSDEERNESGMEDIDNIFDSFDDIVTEKMLSIDSSLKQDSTNMEVVSSPQHVVEEQDSKVSRKRSLSGRRKGRSSAVLADKPPDFVLNMVRAIEEKQQENHSSSSCSTQNRRTLVQVSPDNTGYPSSSASILTETKSSSPNGFSAKFRERLSVFQIVSPFGSKPKSNLQSKTEISSTRNIEPQRKKSEENLDPLLPQKDPKLYYLNYEELVPRVEDETDSIEYVDESNNEDSKEEYEKGVTERPAREIKCATVPRLIEELTSHKNFENKFMYAFLLTYRTFISPSDLFDALIDRYNFSPRDKNISKVDFCVFYDSVLSKVRMRVSQVLKKWIDDHFHDFKQDPLLIAKCNSFIELMKRTKGEVYATQISNTLKKKLDMRERALSSNGYQVLQASDTIPPKIASTLFISNPRALAQQVTLMEYDMFRKVREAELINKNWSKPERQTLSPHIFQMANWFNRLSHYVASRILMEEELENRRDTLTLMIEWAYEMFLLNNFNGVFEVCSALQSSSVFRLKKTWLLINVQVKQKFDEMMKVISSSNNFVSLRKMVYSAKLPCLPYIGIYLTDLTFIEDGNSDELNGKINFIKRRKLAGVISDIKIYQQTPYKFTVDEEAQEYLKSIRSSLSKEEMYSRSLLLEPRETRNVNNLQP